jgi:hypothetical protein
MQTRHEKRDRRSPNSYSSNRSPNFRSNSSLNRSACSNLSQRPSSETVCDSLAPSKESEGTCRPRPERWIKHGGETADIKKRRDRNALK